MKWILGSLLIFVTPGLFALVQDPAHCLKNPTTSCRVKTQRRPQVVEFRKSLLWLAQNSMIEITSGTVKILAGSVWIQSSDETPFETAYIAGTISGDLWVTHDLSKSNLNHLSGELFLRLKSNSKEVVLPVGFENWYAGLQTDGESFQGVLRPLNSAVALNEWTRTFRVPPKLVSSKLEKWTETWKDSVEVGSQIYQESMTRFVASVQEQALRRKKVQLMGQKERDQLLKLYRSKNGLEAFDSPSQGPNSQDF